MFSHITISTLLLSFFDDNNLHLSPAFQYFSLGFMPFPALVSHTLCKRTNTIFTVTPLYPSRIRVIVRRDLVEWKSHHLIHSQKKHYLNIQESIKDKLLFYIVQFRYNCCHLVVQIKHARVF